MTLQVDIGSAHRAVTRRSALVAAAGAALLPVSVQVRAGMPPPSGWLLPRVPAPVIGLASNDPQLIQLAPALAGKVTAVQLMFTGCTSTCPPQGAMFAELATQLPSADCQLLSISIDALGDTPQALVAWQARLGPHPAWRTAVARMMEVERLSAFLKGSEGRSGSHTAQVFLFDRLGRLSVRTGDLPPVADLRAVMATLARGG